MEIQVSTPNRASCDTISQVKIPKWRQAVILCPLGSPDNPRFSLHSPQTTFRACLLLRHVRTQHTSVAFFFLVPSLSIVVNNSHSIRHQTLNMAHILSTQRRISGTGGRPVPLEGDRVVPTAFWRWFDAAFLFLVIVVTAFGLFGGLAGHPHTHAASPFSSQMLMHAFAYCRV